MEKLFPSLKIVVTNYFDVHQDWEVPIPAFFIVTARRSLRSIAELTDQEAQELILLIKKLRQGMHEVLGIKDVYIFQNEDTEHNFHVWMFPRHSWMEEFGRKIESVLPIMKHAQATMVNDNVIAQVKDSAQRMANYMKNFKL